MFADNFGWVGFLAVCFLHRITIPTHEKTFAVVKSGPNATFNLIFIGSGWPWVGELVDFISKCLRKLFVTDESLANHTHPNSPICLVHRVYPTILSSKWWSYKYPLQLRPLEKLGGIMYFCSTCWKAFEG